MDRNENTMADNPSTKSTKIYLLYILTDDNGKLTTKNLMINSVLPSINMILIYDWEE